MPKIYATFFILRPEQKASKSADWNKGYGNTALQGKIELKRKR